MITLKTFLVTILLFHAGQSVMKAQDIRDAIRNGDLLKVKMLVETNPLLATEKIDRNSIALHVAVRNNKIEIARYLIEKGADINSVSKYQGTPLDLAIEAGDTSMINFLKTAGAKSTPPAPVAEKISDNIIRLSFTWGMRNNLVAFCGADGVVLIETGFRKSTAAVIKKVISESGNGQVKFVINTHSHGDHVMGNSFLAPSDSAIINLKNINSGRLNNILSESGKKLVGRTGLSFPVQYEMKFNNERIVIIPYPGLHSSEDILIYFPDSKVLCPGDLLLSQNCPAISANISGYLEFLDKLIDVFPEECLFVSGHGKDLSYNGLKKYRNDIAEMTEIVKAEYFKGKTMSEIAESGLLDSFKNEYSFLDWLGPDRWTQVVYDDLRSGGLK